MKGLHTRFKRSSIITKSHDLKSFVLEGWVTKSFFGKEIFLTKNGAGWHGYNAETGFRLTLMPKESRAKALQSSAHMLKNHLTPIK